MKYQWRSSINTCSKKYYNIIAGNIIQSNNLSRSNDTIEKSAFQEVLFRNVLAKSWISLELLLEIARVAGNLCWVLVAMFSVRRASSGPLSMLKRPPLLHFTTRNLSLRKQQVEPKGGSLVAISYYFKLRIENNQIINTLTE